MARQSNLAYDFERFETQRKVKPKAKVQLEVVKKQQAQKTRYLITNCNQELELLQSDYRTLTAELESTMALNNIETIVTREMGMSKLREDQVTYVSLSDGDSVDAVETHTTSILEQIKATFSQVLEYIAPGENTME